MKKLFKKATTRVSLNTLLILILVAAFAVILIFIILKLKGRLLT